jgi:hypothetical protein
MAKAKKEPEKSKDVRAVEALEKLANAIERFVVWSEKSQAESNAVGLKAVETFAAALSK